MMKNRNFVLGFIFIALGSVWFLDNLNIIDFQLRYLIGGINDLWPLTLVVIGVNIFIKNKTVEKFLWILFLLILMGYSMFIQYNSPQDNYSPNTPYSNQIYSPAIEKGVTAGKVDLEVGGMKFDVTSGTSDFITLRSNIKGLRSNSAVDGDKQSVNIFNNAESFEFDDPSDNSFDLEINESIPWDFDIDCGAIDGTLDLKDVNVKSFNLDMGAGRIEVVLGNKADHSKINIDSGVSQIILNIPKDSGIKVNFEGALNSTNLSDLGLIKNNNTYTSKNYDDAISKYDITVQMGLGEFEIHNY